MKTVICSGEELLVPHQQRFFELFPNTGLYNLYGPTEAAVDVSCWQCQPNQYGTTTPIGTPVANTRLYVVDDSDRQQPIGVMGELLIGGVQVAQGYINQPGLTARQFIADPFGSGQVYRTGDFARWNDDGQLEYLGRKDFQVKVNGVRIELAEIENVLSNYKDIDLCAVTVARHADDHDFLFACYSSRHGCGEIDKTILIEHLKSRLPQYMIPSRFQWLPQFALTTSGKLDRKQLPTPTQEQISRPPVDHHHLDEKQALVLSAWSEVLGTPNIGLNETFFDAGGNSFQLLKVFAILQKQLQHALTSVDMFTYPTIRSLAQFLSAPTTQPRVDTSSRASAIQRAMKARPNFNRRRT